MVFVNYIYDMVVDTQFHKFHGRPFARVLSSFLMKDIGRWLPWVLPGSTGQFYKDDVVHNHSAHAYYITRMEGRVRYAWYCCYMLNRIKQNWSKTAINMMRELDLVTFHMKYYLSDEASKIDVRIWWWKTDDNGNAMYQSYLSKLLKKGTDWRYARTAAMGNTRKKCLFF